MLKRIMMQNIFEVNFLRFSARMGIRGSRDDNFIEH